MSTENFNSKIHKIIAEYRCLGNYINSKMFIDYSTEEIKEEILKNIVSPKLKKLKQRVSNRRLLIGNVDDLCIKELRNLASSYGIQYYSENRKEKLIKLIKEVKDEFTNSNGSKKDSK